MSAQHTPGFDDAPTPCICDRCGRKGFLSDEAAFPDVGEWDGCTLCLVCAEEVNREQATGSAT